MRVQGTAMTTETLLTIDQFFDLSAPPGVYHELLRGRLVEMSIPGFEHGAVQAQAALALGNLCNASFPELICATHTGFLLGPDTVQGPDVAVIRRQAQREMKTYRGALVGAPDLAVEIISPNQSSEDLQEKVDNYLEAGTKTVWVVSLRRHSAMVFHRDGSVRRVAGAQLMDAPDVLPGAGIAVDSLFAPLSR